MEIQLNPDWEYEVDLFGNKEIILLRMNRTNLWYRFLQIVLIGTKWVKL